MISFSTSQKKGRMGIIQESIAYMAWYVLSPVDPELRDPPGSSPRRVSLQTVGNDLPLRQPIHLGQRHLHVQK